MSICLVLTRPVFAQASADSYTFQAFNDSLFYSYKTQLDRALQDGNADSIYAKQYQLAEFYKNAQIYTQAVEHYKLASEEKTQHNELYSATINISLGEIYIALYNYSKARYYLNRSLDFSVKTKNLRIKAKSLQLIGACWEKQENPQKALAFQRQSLAVYETLKDAVGEASVNESIGSVYEDLGDFKKAYLYFEKAYVYFKAVGDERQVNALNNLSDIYRKTGDYTTALTKTYQALNLAQNYANTHQITSAYKDLSKTYALIGDFENAHRFLLKYEKLKEDQFYSQNFSQLNALQTIFDTRENEAQIALLQEQNKTSKARLLALSLLVFTLIASGIIVFYLKKKKRQAALDLQLYKQRALEAELETRAEKARNLESEIQLKTATLSKYSLTIAQKNKVIEDVSGTLQKLSSRKRMDLPAKINEIAQDLEVHLKEDNEWDQFMLLFEEIHPGFVTNLNEKSLQKLTATELRLCLLLRLNLSSKEIASILRITPDSVRVARYRLRKKLPIETQEELAGFMLNL